MPAGSGQGSGWETHGVGPQPAGPVDPGYVAGPVSRTTRDLGVLVAVVLLLAALVKVGSSIEYAVPVSLGNTPISNTDEVIADAEDMFQGWVDAQATRVGADAACYYYRPLGSTQGAVAAGPIAGLLPGGEDADAIDLLLCGPVELSTQALDAVPGLEPQPWLTGIAYYYADESTGAFRGEFNAIIPSALGVLASTGGVKSDALVEPNGHHPSSGAIDDPDWREVTPTGETPPGPGADLLGGDLPGGDLPVDTPELPPGVTLPPDMSIPEVPEVPELPELPGGSGG